MPDGRKQYAASRKSFTNSPMRCLAFIFTLFCGMISVPAETLVLGENAVTSQIARDYNLFRAVHGKQPKKWGEIESIAGKPLNETFKSLQPTTRYAFLENALPIDVQGRRAKIVILSRSPAHDQYAMRGFFGPITGSLQSTLKRYAMVVSEDGYASSISFSETRVQRMFADAGMALPSPDPLGPRPYEKANRIARIIWIACALVICGFAGKLLVVPLFNRS